MPVPASPGSETRPEGMPASLTAVATIPGTSITVRLRGYYDWTVFSRGKFFDAQPGTPWNPAVALSFEGPEGEDARQVAAFVDEPLPPPAEMPKGRYSYQVTYSYEPVIDLGGPRVLIVAGDRDLRFVYVSSDGKKTSGPVEVDQKLALPMPFLKLVPTAIFRNLRVEDVFAFEAFEPQKPVIRVTPTWNGVPKEPMWLPLGASRMFEFDGHVFGMTWRPTSRELGFSLSLYDFHRDFHPGSQQPASFESYLRLSHPTKFPSGEDIKIDMNHPLRLDGWRLFQARFGNDRTTILQVNRDPGLAIIYPACAVVLLGLIVVLFMKKTLALMRKKLERERATPMRHVAHAIGAVAAVGIGPAIFSVYVAIRPWAEENLGLFLPLSGWPAFVFGLSFVVLFPIMVVAWFTRPLHRRLEASLSPAGAAP
jgi:hypothetical protein